ncbi:hypothetical protein O6H91_Y304000 [Diphasiastrum complanatum]|nr:hypothetical protein O6H91_Y304000 [Diphasiastrum complanatum]
MVGVTKAGENPVEVHVVLSLLTRIHDACKMKTPSIGVISPYKGQVLALENVLETCHSEIQNMDIEVKTIDGFQGKEKDIIIFSTVRANKEGNIGFLADQ